jgi:hypothetical protein
VFAQIYSEHQQWLLQANVIYWLVLQWTMNVNLFSRYAPCICRQVVVCVSPFVICCLILSFENDCKQLKPTCSCLEQLKLCLCCNLSHLNCLCDPLHEKHCNCVVEVDWPRLQLIFDCGDAVTILGNCVVWSNAVVSGMIWCAVCIYHFSFIEGCIRVSVPCEPVVYQLTVWWLPSWNWSQLICAGDCGLVIGACSCCVCRGDTTRTVPWLCYNWRSESGQRWPIGWHPNVDEGTWS